MPSLNVDAHTRREAKMRRNQDYSNNHEYSNRSYAARRTFYTSPTANAWESKREEAMEAEKDGRREGEEKAEVEVQPKAVEEHEGKDGEKPATDGIGTEQEESGTEENVEVTTPQQTKERTESEYIASADSGDL